MAKTAYVPFDESVQKVIAQVADGHGLEHISLLSDAGHDAEEIAALCPTAMIFVRGGYDGISHNPREYSTPRHAPTASTSWPPPSCAWPAGPDRRHAPLLPNVGRRKALALTGTHPAPRLSGRRGRAGPCSRRPTRSRRTSVPGGGNRGTDRPGAGGPWERHAEG
jgi:hypothetical protein